MSELFAMRPELCWGEKIWQRYRVGETRVFSPHRSDTLIRLVDCHWLQLSVPDALEQTYIAFAGDSPDVLLAKVIYQANRVLEDKGSTSIRLATPIQETAFVLRRHLMDRSRQCVQVNRQDLLAVYDSKAMLAEIFSGSPSWVNLRVVFLRGLPRLVHFECQAPDRRQPGLDASQIVLGWSETQDLTIL